MRKSLIPLFVSIVLLLGVTACGGDNAQTGKGTSSLRSAEEDMATNEEHNDMRLGLDRYKGMGHKFLDSDGDMQTGLDRENGWDGFDQDGVNNWRDYTQNTTDTNHNNTQLTIADDIANQLASLNAVRTAHVLLTNQHAYVAIMTEYGYRDSIETVRQQIVDQVRAGVPLVKQVFVSGDPQFISSVEHIIGQMRKGTTDQGVIREFNTIVERVFPLTNTGANQLNP